MTSRSSYLNQGVEDQMEIIGFRKSAIQSTSTYLLHVCTCGLSALFLHWYPHWALYLTHRICALQDATIVLIIDAYKGKFEFRHVKRVHKTKLEHVVRIPLSNGKSKYFSDIRWIRCKKLTYIWDPEEDNFTKLTGLDSNHSIQQLVRMNGLNRADQDIMRCVYGPNSIDVPLQSIGLLFVLEALTPFYIFQVFSLCVWLAEAYYYYAIAIIIMSLIGICSSVLQTRRNQLNLRGTINSAQKVRVIRPNGDTEDVDGSMLVPGDRIIIPENGCDMQCDALLITGQCIVNESMLTGESIPIIKNAPQPIDDSTTPYNIRDHAKQTLFSGTKVIQTRFYCDEPVMAVVLRTGFLTTKGDIVRSILYPPPVDFKFDQDSYKFIWILTIIAILGFIYTVVYKYSRHLDPLDILIKALDIITIAIPPALPAAMTVGKLYALNRLRKRSIYCINSRVINVSGSVDCVCFDKTGTLTEDGLDLLTVIPFSGCQIDLPISAASQFPADNLLLHGLATCHSLTRINGKLCGDPMDVKMFQFTGWQFKEPPDIEDTSKCDLVVPTIVSARTERNETLYEYGIVHQHQFSSDLQRMSVVVKGGAPPPPPPPGTQPFRLFCKGSPESIMSLCRPSIGTTTKFAQRLQQILLHYTEKGYRVIAIATRTINLTYHKVVRLSRTDLEADLQLLGLVVFENRLKPQTKDVMRQLREANMRLVMLTGDHCETATCIARECGLVPTDMAISEVMVNMAGKSASKSAVYYAPKGYRSDDHFQQLTKQNNDDSSFLSLNIWNHNNSMASGNTGLVVTGSVLSLLQTHFPQKLDEIILKAVIFARMTSSQKQMIVEKLQSAGHYVAMCGDGANDCGALRAAHVGVSLSEAEASVASPFTSRRPDISCMLDVIREGRAALVTSFGIFKLMLCYSLTEFASVIILYAIDSNLTSVQFLFIDICLVLNFASSFGMTKAWPQLHHRPPPSRLLAFGPLCSMVTCMVIFVAFQVAGFYWISTYDWFRPYHIDLSDPNATSGYENYAVFCISLFQYITMAVVFSKGTPYRMPLYTNLFYTISVAAATISCVYITVAPVEWLANFLDLVLPPELNARLLMVALSAACFAFCSVCVNWPFEQQLVRWRRCCSMSEKNLRCWKSRRRIIPMQQGYDKCTALQRRLDEKYSEITIHL